MNFLNIIGFHSKNLTYTMFKTHSHQWFETMYRLRFYLETLYRYVIAKLNSTFCSKLSQNIIFLSFIKINFLELDTYK
jgi:hypothetical protein